MAFLAKQLHVTRLSEPNRSLQLDRSRNFRVFSKMREFLQNGGTCFRRVTKPHLVEIAYKSSRYVYDLFIGRCLPRLRIYGRSGVAQLTFVSDPKGIGQAYMSFGH